jgi:hypothetical protein
MGQLLQRGRRKVFRLTLGKCRGANIGTNNGHLGYFFTSRISIKLSSYDRIAMWASQLFAMSEFLNSVFRSLSQSTVCRMVVRSLILGIVTNSDVLHRVYNSIKIRDVADH